MTVEKRLGLSGAGLILFAPFLVGGIGATDREIASALAPGTILLLAAAWKARVRGSRGAEETAAPGIERFSQGLLNALPWLALLLLLLYPVLVVMTFGDR